MNAHIDLFSNIHTVNSTKYFWLFSPTQLFTLCMEYFKRKKKISFEDFVFNEAMK